MKQVEFPVNMSNVTLCRQSGCFIFCCEAGNVVGRFHRLLDSCLRKIAGGSIATLLPYIDGNTQRFVAVAFDIFKLALAHTDRQAAAFRGLGSGVGGTEFFGMCQGGVNQVFKKITVKAEA